MTEDSTLIRNLGEVSDKLWDRGGVVHGRVGGAAWAWACGEIIHPQAPLLVLLPDSRLAEEFVRDRETLFPLSPVYLLNELPLTAQALSSRPLLLQRGETIGRWGRGGGVLVTTPGACLTPCLLGDGDITVAKGKEYDRDKLVSWLERGGYQRSDLVWSPGQYVVRGFIVDVFDPVHALPLRFEFFDETVERIRAFKPASQKSVAELDEIEIHSVSAARKALLPELIPNGARMVIFEPQKVEAQANSYYWLSEELRGDAGGLDKLPSWEEVFMTLARMPRLRVTKAVDGCDVSLDTDDCPPFRGDPESLVRLCGSLGARGFHIKIISVNPRFLDKKALLFESMRETPMFNEIEVVSGSLSGGFVDRQGQTAYLSDRELSGVSANFSEVASARSANAWRAPSEWRDRLEIGQLVVHEDYGIAAFRGISEFKPPPSYEVVPPPHVAPQPHRETSDAITLEFAENRRLLIPVAQFYKLTPLPDHEGDEIQLSSLSSKKWRRSVEESREKAKEEAKILISLFARREFERREPFLSDDELYDSFAAAFPHSETADQLTAISDIMNDMNRPFPMDRLLVGDVGFGKTEVAMRAAFRVILSGKQVCVLVPTTILAQQHYATFTSRMAGFTVKIGLLSRFVTKRDIEKALGDAKKGNLDILIGTHKLLQKGVEFRDIGLLVIDEEHRFGVMHKEELKRTYGAVDILSLSATPIPRTLSLSLRGLRDISVLSTPPNDRRPVTTYAGPWQGNLVRKAVTAELTRGGQVYFVTNRISRMESQKDMLTNFFPDAKIKIAHGQMPERELESTMLGFYDGKIDILLCTTIIESGLDVGRANTIIVDDAQELGLAQMYQLRGRVGRRNENAFAWFFYPPDTDMRRETLDRLDAISSFTGLGSGYSLARRDLEIRGAGEAGGTKQHGNSKTGFHLFYRMLEQEISKLRGGTAEKVDITSDITGSIPNFYIPQDDVRVTLYRRVMKAEQAGSMDEAVSLGEEMADRFGPLPESARCLVDLASLRSGSAVFGIKTLAVTRRELKVRGDFSGDSGKKLALSLKAKKGWNVIGGSMSGPGGAKGVRDLAEAMASSR
ncbi:transcription-repair-coupling factor [Synergistales bacterium]|nr:transcription-repair-coupling factor [Synergistales bacterium]